MVQGFYELLGVSSDASTDDVRSAYTRVVAQLARRRTAIDEQGGDPTPIDLARTQVDEAWAVLSRPTRRRRYDAMRALSASELRGDANEVWRRIAGALVHPGAGAAAELLRVATTLKVGALPPPPVPESTGPSYRSEPTGGRVATNPGQRGRTDPRGVAASPPPQSYRSEPTLVPRPSTDAGVRSDPFGGAFGGDSDAGVVEHRRAATVSPEEVTVTARPPMARVEAAPSPLVEAIRPLTVEPPVRTARPAPRAAVVAVEVEPDDVDLSTMALPNGRGAAVTRLPAAQAPKQRTLAAEDIARLTDRHGYTGAFLKAVREAKAVQLQAVADGTRISLKYLEAIEGDQHDRLPSATFVRGYVKQMARFLGLDEEAVSAGYARTLRG
jgi:curved DNA-binding protein CbpA